MNNLSFNSNEDFIKSQESLVQGAKRTPKPINLLQDQLSSNLNKYNAAENAKTNKNKLGTKPIILLNEEKYESNSKENLNPKQNEERKRKPSRKTERKLDVEEHEKALNEIKKIASLMDSNNTLNRKGHSRVNSRSNLKLTEKIWGYEGEDFDERYEILMGRISNSENSSKSNSFYTVNSSNNESENYENNGENNNYGSNNSIAFVVSPGSESSVNLDSINLPKKSQQKLVIPNNPNHSPMYNGLSANTKKEIFFSKEDVFKKNADIDDDIQSNGSKKDEFEYEEKKVIDKKKKSKLKQFLKLHRENCLLDMPNALYTDIISESIKILTKTSQNYASQLGKKDESTVGSIKHLKHLQQMMPTGNQLQQHIDNNSGKFGPGYYQLCAPIDENGQYVQLKEKILINSLESLNSIN